MKKKLVQVYGTDGAALYVNGKLVCNWFTVGHANLVEALGFKITDSRRLDQKWYDANELPKRLSDCVFACRHPAPERPLGRASEPVHAGRYR